MLDALHRKMDPWRREAIAIALNCESDEAERPTGGKKRLTEIKTVPHVPLSRPFVERLIGTIRREYLDQILFWSTADLETKLFDFQVFYNRHRTHGGLEGCVPEPTAEGTAPAIGLDTYQWRRHCRGLYETPVAA
jgi:hypothetical protein